MKKLALLLTSALCLVSCSSSNLDGKAPPDLTFQHVVPVNLPVANVSVERAAGYNAGSNATSFVVPFDEKIEAYMRRKVQAVGGDKNLHVVIEQASVKESLQPSTNSVAGFLDVAGFNVYELGLILNVMAQDSYGGQKGVRLKLGRTIKVSEHASIAEREFRQMEGVESLFKELDTNMTRITLQELDLIPYQNGNMAGYGSYGAAAPTAPVYDNTYDNSYGGAPSADSAYPSAAYPPSYPVDDENRQHPRVITGGPSMGGDSTGASTGAIERQEL
ncbi:MAG: hypothetical protein LRY76_04570 [Alphaproteobacteria bacterium]|nr:hypothetical protein [Alphaproteobacteria bacterium]